MQMKNYRNYSRKSRPSRNENLKNQSVYNSRQNIERG